VKEKQTLGLCIIARNEEKNIARCIESVKGFVDEIVVVDTGSTDKTAAIARRLGARVYKYKWDDNFSNARNYAMGKMRSRWLLLLDADEALDPSARKPLRQFIETTDLDGAHLRVRNYTGAYSPERYNLHNAFRLLRNNGKYKFTGAIHEQITRDGSMNLGGRFAVLDLIVHHYGYLDEAVREKNKRARNLPILEKMLAEKPEDAFTLFNIGNEYLSAGDTEKALAYYTRAKENVRDFGIAFVPHLYFRMANALDGLGRQETALKILQEGLTVYPHSTDFEFLRGNIYLRQRRYTLAVASFEKCLKMGRPPAALEFLEGCGTHRAAFMLGDIYARLEDWGRALECYSKTLQFNPAMTGALFPACHALNKLHDDKERVREELFKFFADPKYPPNILAAAEILITEELYTEALKALEMLPPVHEHKAKEMLLIARAEVYLGERERAEGAIYEALQLDEKDALALSAHLLLALALRDGDEKAAEKALELTGALNAPDKENAYRLLADIALERDIQPQEFEKGGQGEMEALLEVYDTLLRMRRFELFEQLLRAMNFIDRPELLLRLGHLFYARGFTDLAVSYVLRSIKELDVIDEQGALILSRHVTGTLVGAAV
jgi:glycosyltransferase involved in cell wall biosynthesis